MTRASTVHQATGPNQVWSWDITWLPTTVRGSYLYLYLIMDVWSRRIVGWCIAEHESADVAAALITQSCCEGNVDPRGLVLHSDNGGPMRGSTMISTLQWLGVIPSFSRPHVSDDNPYSEALFRTLKHTPAYPRLPFADLASAIRWVARFVEWYNGMHRHSAIRYVMVPAAVAGYSVGELACYAVAGAIDANSLIAVAHARAALMGGSAVRPGNLVAQRGLRRPKVEALCRGRDAWVAIAIDDDASVVGGTSSAIDALRRDMERAGAQITCLRVGVASHTPLLADAVDPFRKVLAESGLRAPTVPVIAGIDAAPVTTRDRAIETLAMQLASPIEWAQCLDTLFERGCRVFLELGPGRALSKMAVDRLHDVEARSVEEFGDPGAIAGWVRRG